MQKLFTFFTLLVFLCSSFLMTAQVGADECVDAIDITSLLGGPFGEAQTSTLYHNTDATSIDDPTGGIDACWGETGITNTIWFSFIGDGGTYEFRSVECKPILECSTS